MKRKLLLTAVLMLTLTLFTGCGKPETPEQIVAASQKAAKGLTCTQTDTTMEMSLSMDLPAAGSFHTVNLDMKLDAATTTAREPYASKTDMTIAMHRYSPEVYMDQRTKQNSEIYSVLEDGQLVSYTQTQGMWVRTETGLNPEDMVKNADAIMEAANLTFQKDESVTEWEGTPAVCLTAAMTGESVQSMMETATEGMKQMLGQVGELDFSVMTCDTRIYLDAETYLPLAQEITIGGMDKVLGSVQGDPAMNIEFSTCTATTRYRSFAPQPPIQLPEGAKENALRWERLLKTGPDNGDGTYTIGEGNAFVNVEPPEGFRGAGGYQNHVFFRMENQEGYLLYYITYTVSVAPNDPELAGACFTEQIDTVCAAAQENGMTFTRETTQIPTADFQFTCDSVTAQIDEGREKTVQCIWAPIKQEDGLSYYVSVRIDDARPVGMEAQEDLELTPEQLASILEAVKPAN